jgi:hypothetical protein
MVVLDKGPGLRAALHQIARRPQRRATLYLLAPFIETDTALWRATLGIANAGVRVSSFTRYTADRQLLNALHQFNRLGGRTVFVENLHAKAFLWLADSPKEKAAFIGSHNFTRSSEMTAVELGVLIWGDGWIESRIYDALRSAISALPAGGDSPAWKMRCRKASRCRVTETHDPRKELTCR